mmetsp:Transcript_29227/g.67283  ORF Transcript_29227/g.67283 Transcript_29227/m.67283 type:complete len:264 (+) Transcript_29227:519-1310(+)
MMSPYLPRTVRNFALSATVRGCGAHKLSGHNSLSEGKMHGPSESFGIFSLTCFGRLGPSLKVGIVTGADGRRTRAACTRCPDVATSNCASLHPTGATAKRRKSDFLHSEIQPRPSCICKYALCSPMEKKVPSAVKTSLCAKTPLELLNELGDCNMGHCVASTVNCCGCRAASLDALSSRSRSKARLPMSSIGSSICFASDSGGSHPTGSIWTSSVCGLMTCFVKSLRERVHIQPSCFCSLRYVRPSLTDTVRATTSTTSPSMR